jgi:hypothetical protein
MLFIAEFEDVYIDHPERLPEPGQHMEAHIAFLAEQHKWGDRRRSSAPFHRWRAAWRTLDTQCCEQDRRRSPLQANTFWQAGLRKSVVVSHWAIAVSSQSLTDCMTANGVE